MSEPNKLPASDPPALLARIKAEFPSMQWNSFRYIDQGWDHEVIMLDDALVFRFPNDQEYTQLLKTEIAILSRLKPLVGATIPDYQYVAHDSSFAGYPIVAGQQLLKPVFASLSERDQASLAQQLADFLSTVHAFIPIANESESAIKSYMEQDQASTKQQLRTSLESVLSKEDFVIATSMLADVDELLQQHWPRVFLHGDIYRDHLLWDAATKQLGVIDFSDMTMGDPAIDFAELYEYGDDFIGRVYDLYKGQKDDTFLSRARKYQRWASVYTMTDHFIYHKTSFAIARQAFDELKTQTFRNGR